MAVLKLLERELEARLVELVDLLNKPAGEYAPRGRRILIEFLNTILRLVEGDDEPTQPRAPVRQRQQTMELHIDELVELTEQEKRRLGNGR